MRILAIDPRLRSAGDGCVEFSPPSPTPKPIEAGAIKLKQGESTSSRLKMLFENVTDVIKDVQPDIIAVETVFTHKDRVSTATILGYARGVILLAGEQASLDLIEITPAEIKKSVTGNGRATKEQVQHAVQNILSLAEPPNPPDVADALAIAITAGLRTM